MDEGRWQQQATDQDHIVDRSGPGPDHRWVGPPDPSQQEGLFSYAYVGDDPMASPTPPAWTKLDVFCGIGGALDQTWNGAASAFASFGQGIAGLAVGTYNFVAGDDIATLTNAHASGVDKFLAVVDLASNALAVVPIGGEGSRRPGGWPRQHSR